MAADPWTKEEKWVAGAAVGLTIIDWGQTRHIAKNPDKYFERNGVLGDHPSKKDVDTYFAAYIALQLLIGHNLSHKWRTPFLGGVALVEAGYVVHNHIMGIRVDF